VPRIGPRERHVVEDRVHLAIAIDDIADAERRHTHRHRPTNPDGPAMVTGTLARKIRLPLTAAPIALTGSGEEKTSNTFSTSGSSCGPA
jgi:hypothetical protein